MMASDFIVEVSEADFDQQVLLYSEQIPVIVDFWAEWCMPCRVLGPLLEKLAQEANGAFRLAKVNVDQNQKLAQRYNIRSIPVVKAFKEGKPVAEFVGAIPETRIREFLQTIVPSQNDLLIEKAFSLLDMGQAKNAENTLREVLKDQYQPPKAILGLVKSLLLQGQTNESLLLLRNFPASHEFSEAERLFPLAEALDQQEKKLISDDDDPLNAAFLNALRLFRRGNLEASMDGLLDILRQNKHYRNNAARLVIISILELLNDRDPVTRQYRQELASVLF